MKSFIKVRVCRVVGLFGLYLEKNAPYILTPTHPQHVKPDTNYA